MSASEAMNICPHCLKQFEANLELCPDDGHTLRRFSVHREDPMIGTVLDGRWVIEEKIGEGGMGAVYRAQQLSVDRKVAIKTMHSKLADGEGKNYLERFLREASLATKVSHPHLVSIYDFGQSEDGLLYLVMEHLEGMSLSRVLKRVELSLAQALQIMIQICQGLSAAHQAHIVHRDLKPDNIFLLDMPGGDIFIKVLDFGIAKNLDSNQQMTQTGQVFGTPEYMSPEQCRGSSRIDERSDLYSLGCILYELLCGAPPFRSDSMLKVLFAHVSDPPPEPISAQPRCAQYDALIALTMNLLEKNPRARVESVLEVRAMLEVLKEQAMQEPALMLPAWSKSNEQAVIAGISDTADIQLSAEILAPTVSQRGVDARLKALNEPTGEVEEPPSHATTEPKLPEQEPQEERSTTPPLALDRDTAPPTQAPKLDPAAQTPADAASAQADHPSQHRAIFIGIFAVGLVVLGGALGSSLGSNQQSAQTPLAAITPPSLADMAPEASKTPVNPNAAPQDMGSAKPQAVDAAPDAAPSQGASTPPTADGAADAKPDEDAKVTKPKPKTSKTTKQTAPSLSDADKLRNAAGQRAHSVVKKQSAQLATKLRPCIDIALKRGDIAPQKERLSLVFSYGISPTGKVEDFFVDPNKSSALPSSTLSCIKGRAAGYTFSSPAKITAVMYIKEQQASYSIISN